MEPVPAAHATQPLRRTLRFVRAALGRASGPLILVAALLGSARAAAISLTNLIRGGGAPLGTLYRLVPSEITAGCMLVAVLIAQQFVRNGARRFSAYVPAVIIAAALSGLIATPLLALMHELGVQTNMSYPRFGALGTALYYCTDALARGGLAAFIFANRESLLTSIRKLRAAELQRSRTERSLAKSHLMAVQATMEPEALLSTLEAVRALYEHSSPEADARLAAFIEHLRSVSVAIRA